MARGFLFPSDVWKLALLTGENYFLLSRGTRRKEAEGRSGQKGRSEVPLVLAISLLTLFKTGSIQLGVTFEMADNVSKREDSVGDIPL